MADAIRASGAHPNLEEPAPDIGMTTQVHVK